MKRVTILLFSVLAGIALLAATVTAVNAQPPHPGAPGYWELIDWQIDSTSTSNGTTYNCDIAPGYLDCIGQLAGSSFWYINQILETNRKTYTDSYALVMEITRIDYSPFYFITGSTVDDENVLKDDYVFQYTQNHELVCFSWDSAPSAWITWADANCDVHETSTFRGSLSSLSHYFHWAHQKTGPAAFEILFTNASFVYAGPPQTPGGGGGTPGGIITGPVKYASWLCAFNITETQVISQGGMTVTQVITTSYTTPANLLSNWSFEEKDGSNPLNWGTAVNGAIQDLGALWWIFGQANYGYYSLNAIADYSAIQSMPLYSPGLYLAGFDAKCVGGLCNNITIKWNGASVLSSSSLSQTYQSFTGTHTTGGGGAWLELAFNEDPDVYLDNAFVIPWDSISDTLNCDPDFFPPPGDPAGGAAPPNCVVDPETGGCITVPVGGAGATCYYCAAPNNTSAAAVSIWLAWLGCVLRNMFSCSLRVWLMRVQNQVLGVYQSTLAIMLFIGPFAQSAANYAAAMGNWLVLVLANYWAALAGALANMQQVVVITNNGTSFLEEIIDLLLALAMLMVNALSALVNVVNLLVTVLIQSWQAFDAPPHQLAALIDPNYYNNDPLQFATNIAAAGINSSKIILYLAWGVQTVDFIGASIYLNYAQYPILAVFGLVLLFWAQKQFRGVMPT